MNKPVIGLIGGMGSGKSRVADEFARRDAAVISGDRLGHEALKQPDVRERVVRRWGMGVLDDRGEVSRRMLGVVVFADPAELRALEEMVFPWIERGFREQIAAAQDNPEVRLVVLDAAVMLEAGWDHLCNVLVYVHAPREARLRRLAEQRGWTAKEVEARENSQYPLTEKATRADEAVDNGGPPERLAAQVDRLLTRWVLTPATASTGLTVTTDP